MIEERQPWERREGESNRWFQRFEAFRLMGPGRSLLACANQEKARRGLKESRNAPGSWKRAAKDWGWIERAQAWDMHLTTEQEARWQAQIMGESEVLARLSEHGRNDLREFFKISERWTENPLPTEEVIRDEQRLVKVGRTEEMHTFYLVKKVVLDVEALMDPTKSFRVKKFADSPKNGLAIELVSVSDTLKLMGENHKLFTSRSEVEVPNPLTLKLEDGSLSDEERAARIAAILKAAEQRALQAETSQGMDEP